MAHGVASSNGLPPPLSSSLSLSNIHANMSAVRRGDRRAARNQHSSPYNRPNAQSKKSVGVPSHVLHKYFSLPPPFPRSAETKRLRQSWSLSGFFSFLNPLRNSKSSEGPEEESSSEVGAGYDERQASDGSESEEASHPPEILSQRGHAVRHNFLSSLLLLI